MYFGVFFMPHSVEQLCRTWRVAVRRVWGLPHNTHNFLLPLICCRLLLMTSLWSYIVYCFWNLFVVKRQSTSRTPGIYFLTIPSLIYEQISETTVCLSFDNVAKWEVGLPPGKVSIAAEQWIRNCCLCLQWTYWTSKLRTVFAVCTSLIGVMISVFCNTVCCHVFFLFLSFFALQFYCNFMCIIFWFYCYHSFQLVLSAFGE